MTKDNIEYKAYLYFREKGLEYVDNIDELIAYHNKLEKENAELKNKLTAIRNAKDKYDMSKDKSIIKAFGAEYTLFCVLERILEDWQEGDQLTKAKEILRSLYFIIQSRIDYKNNIEIADEMWRVEQFIKEIEK